MTEETAASADVTDAAHEPRECMPCSGTGEVISNLGGTPSKVTCPWCEGSGVRVPGIDAQAAWAARQGEADGPPTPVEGEGNPPSPAPQSA